jgi:[acyl-carrier-protein] S-malonyltransferase
MASVLIFPGQGSQKVGMSASLVNGFRTGMSVMEEIEDAISFKISKLIDEGPLEELTKTENAQIAIFSVGMVCVRVLEKEYGFCLPKKCKYLAGHSLGEYTALCAAGVFSISDAARLVRMRGEIMSNACSNPEEFLMVALLGVCASDIKDLVKPYQTGRNICVIANDNSPTQVVISGHRKTVLSVSEDAKKTKGAVKAIPLNTSGPFHSPLMAQASIQFDQLLSNGFEYKDFQIPVIMNGYARPLTKRENIHSYLLKQMTGKVRWRETMELMINDQDVDRIVEIAPGKILSSMAKRAYPSANIFNIETVSEIEEFIKSV